MLLLDSEGKERVRLEGYLPNNDFVAALMSGRGRIAFVQKKYSDAERWYGDVGARFANSHFARRRTATETQVISRKRARRSSPVILDPCASLEGFRRLPRPCKLLQVPFLSPLKRLASAVQLRPWPPYFQ